MNAKKDRFSLIPKVFSWDVLIDLGRQMKALA